MVKTSYITVSGSAEEKFYAGLKSSDRFMFSRLVRKDTLLSRKRVKNLTQRSLLPAISLLWADFTPEQKESWNSAAAEIGRNGWQLFVQDQCIRIKNEMAGTAIPSLLHQSWVGELKIADPASEIKLVQLHPNFYWVSKKISGKKNMYEPVKIVEGFLLPLKIGLNYSSDLSAQSGNAFAKFYAKIWYSYQGRDLFEYLEIPLDFKTDWKHAEATISSITGILVGYQLVIHLFDLKGSLYCDNIIAEHSGQNWARDPFCRDIYQVFTRAFYQIPKHWAAEILPDGAEYDSIYKDF